MSDDTTQRVQGRTALVFGSERVIYLGNGEWQPLDDTTNH